MSISTSGWRGVLAVAATCVFAGACSGDDDDAADTGETEGTTAEATTSGTGSTSWGRRSAGSTRSRRA